MTQFPSDTRVRSAPLRVQTDEGVAVKETVSPLLADAARVIGPSSGPTMSSSCTHEMTCGLSATVNDCVTGGAATTVAEPAWEATIVHVPALSTVIVCTDSVHTGVVDDVSVTVKPAEEEAVISGAASPKTIVDLLRVNVRVCGLLTAKVRVTGVAAFHFAARPAWEAVIEQLPSALIVTVPVGVIVHTVRVLLANATASLLEAVAVRA